MDFVVIAVVAFAASILTFFSGFGLGTILLPVFAIWFPVDLAVALTAIVHFMNNLFKLALVGKHANKSIVIRFGIPAILAAFIGAGILLKMADLSVLFEYNFFGHSLQVAPVKFTIAILMIVFTLFEIIPKLKNLQVDPKYLAIGGLMSGFFGGLSGHQGALRSAFLLRFGLTKESFVATGTVIACLIDVARIGVYSKHFTKQAFSEGALITAVAVASAFIGAYIGSRVLHKITMGTVQLIVSMGLFLLAVALGLGII